MLNRNAAYRGLRLLRRISKLTEYKFQKRTFDPTTFDKKGRAEENRYFLEKQKEQIKLLKKQLENLEASHTQLKDELVKTTDVLKKLAGVTEEKK